MFVTLKLTIIFNIQIFYSAALAREAGDRDLEREIKKQKKKFLLEEQHENFVEMLAATNARRKLAAVKKR